MTYRGDYGQNNLNESLSYSTLGNILNKSNVGDYLYEEKDECGNVNRSKRSNKC